MPFCQNCRFEYLPGITHCPDCGAVLVEQLLPEKPITDESGFEQVLLCTLFDDIHISLLRKALSSAGIPSRDSAADNLFGVYKQAWNLPIQIYVNRRNLMRAQIIYRDHELSVGQELSQP